MRRAVLLSLALAVSLAPGLTGQGAKPIMAALAGIRAEALAAHLEMARAFASSPVKPTRSLVFAFWTGEEEGKFGSGYYVRHPHWPLERTAVYLNLDMIGHP